MRCANSYAAPLRLRALKTSSSVETHLMATSASLCLIFFVARARCLSAGLRYLRLTRLPRHDRGPVPGGNRSAASCLCTVLRRTLYHYATRSPSASLCLRFPAASAFETFKFPFSLMLFNSAVRLVHFDHSMYLKRPSSVHCAMLLISA